MSTDQRPVLCRPALPRDRKAVMEILAETWEGQDYVAEVWDRWLMEEPGVLAVAEREGEIVGQGHLLDMGLGEWWMEGLRVRPSAQGEGIGSHLHDYFLKRWEDSGGAVVRLATHVHREAVHQMCARTGFERIAGVVLTTADPLDGGKHPNFQSAADEPVEAHVDRLRTTATTESLAGLMNLNWRFAHLQPNRLVGPAAPSRWRWRGGEGLVLVLGAKDEDHEVQVSALDVPPDEIPELLLDLRRWAGRNGAAQVLWLAPMEDGFVDLAAAAGFRVSEEDRLYIYERLR